jgi:hypothetical protein
MDPLDVAAHPGFGPQHRDREEAAAALDGQVCPGEQQARWPNASGRVADMTRLASITTSSASRTTCRSASNQLVSQAL